MVLLVSVLVLLLSSLMLPLFWMLLLTHAAVNTILLLHVSVLLIGVLAITTSFVVAD
jgi:hypothetical protein